MPADLDDLAAAEPVFEELDGWPEVSSGSTGTAVPAAATRFVERVSALCGIPVWATSWGAGRSQTVVSRDPFEAQPI
jgi:adenylosuccinate synthase